MNLWKALRDGIRAATRIPALLVVVFVVDLIGALALTAPVYLALDAWVGHRLAARDMAQDFNSLLPIESLLGNSAALQAGTPLTPGAQAEGRAAAATLIMMMGAVLVAWLVSPLPSVMLGGGVLLTYAEGRFAWQRFLWGAWHWLFPFLVLALVCGVCALLVAMLGAGVLVAVEAATADFLTTPVLGATVLVYAVLTMAFEYARVIAAVEGTRNVFRTLGRAVVFIARQPVQTFGLYLLMTAIGVALIPLYSGIVAPVIPFAWGLVAIAAQQLFIATQLWTRLARWAGEVALYRQRIVCEG